MDDSEEEEEDQDQEEEEEELDEPRLAYARVSGIEYIFKRDRLSALAWIQGQLVIGTQGGVVHRIDKGQEVKRYHLHQAAITDLDAKDGWFGTAGLDGRVSLLALGSDESYTFDQGRPVRAMALDPEIGRRSVGQAAGLGGLSYVRGFVAGGMKGQVLLYARGWTGSHRTTVLTEGEIDCGPIWSLAWDHGWIVWSNDVDLSFYNALSGQVVRKLDIGLLATDAPRPDLHRTHMKWLSPNLVLVGWATTLRLCEVMATAIKVTETFSMDALISGLGSLDQDVLLLAYQEGLDPDLRLMTRSGQELSNDGLTIKDVARHRCNDYWLVGGPRQFFIGSQQEVISCTQRTVDDRLQWLELHSRFREGYELCQKEGLKDARRMKLGLGWLRSLLNQKNWSEVVDRLDILQDIEAPASAWEDVIFRFIENDQLASILPHIPTTPRLDSTLYELVLGRLLQTDQPAFIRTVQSWPSSIYNIRSVTTAVETYHIRDAKNIVLMDCLAQLYLANGQPEKALGFYLRLKRDKAFDLIQQYKLFDAVREDVVELMRFNQESRQEGQEGHGHGLTILVANVDAIPIQDVVKQLDHEPYFMYQYLDTLYQSRPDETTDYHDLLIKLYASYSQSSLMALLKSSNHYNLESTLTVCQDAGLLREQVYLLGRMGKYRQALKIITQDLNDVGLAITFAKEIKDDELWADLVHHAKSRPDYILPMLENGDRLLPLIKAIDPNLDVPQLGQALEKALAASAQLAVYYQGLRHVLFAHERDIATKILKRQKAGLLVLPSTRCLKCKKPLDESSGALCAFLCSHLYHVKCLEDTEDQPPMTGNHKIDLAARKAARMNAFSIHQARSRTEAVRTPTQLAANRQMRTKLSLGHRLRARCPSCKDATT